MTPRRIALTIACAGALMAAPACGAQASARDTGGQGTHWQPWASLDIGADAGPVSIAAALDDWHGTLDRGRHQQTDNTVHIGLAQGGRSLSLFWRHAQVLEFSDDTARLYHAQRNGTALVPGTRYEFALDALRFSALGLAWRQPVFSRAQADLFATVSLFHASDLLDGRIGGSATVIDADSFRYDANVDYRYDEDVLFDRVVLAPDGIGAALDLEARWLPAPRIAVALTLRDVAALIRWRDVPSTTASASSDRTWTDNAGNPVTGPAVSGREATLSGWSQRIPPTGTLALEAGITPRTQVTVQLERHLAGNRSGLLLTQRIGELSLHAIWYPQARGGGLGISLPLFSLRMSGDALAHDSANWQRLQLDVGAH